MTNLVRGADEQMLKGMFSGIPESEWKTVDQGAATLVVAGFDPELDGTCLAFHFHFQGKVEEVM